MAELVKFVVDAMGGEASNRTNQKKNESQWNGGKTFGSCTIPPVKVSYHTFSQKAIIYHAIHILTIYNRIKVL